MSTVLEKLKVEVAELRQDMEQLKMALIKAFDKIIIVLEKIIGNK